MGGRIIRMSRAKRGESAGFSLVRFLVGASALKLIALGTAIYLVTAVVFAIFYAICQGVTPDDTSYRMQLYDYVYFALVTQTTIGYGDFSPTGYGKIIFVFHSLFAIIFFTSFLGVVVAKVFLPSVSGLHVSKFVVFYPDIEHFRLYLFNKQRSPIEDVEFSLRLRSPSSPGSLILDQNDVMLTRTTTPRLSRHIVWLIDTKSHQGVQESVRPSGTVTQRLVALTPADAISMNRLVFQVRGTYYYNRHITTVEFDSTRIRCGRFVILQKKHGKIDFDRVDQYERCKEDFCQKCRFWDTCTIDDRWPDAK
jgi:hypothetical protein